jgi:DNA replication protein DnaC
MQFARNGGASGLGKSWLACALGHKACRDNISVLYTRMARLFADLAIAHGDARYARLLRSIARVKLLIPDDWGPEAPSVDGFPRDRALGRTSAL